MKIGLSQRILFHKGRAYDCIEHGWYNLLSDHTLFYLPNRLDQDFDNIADNLDAFIITGGDDSTLRRTVEIKLATKVMQRNKPVIGVCHGAFLITDLLGGVVEEVEHHMDTTHFVIYNGDVVDVNSYHNLAIKKLHNSGTALCIDESGNIESFIDGKLAGIVWHPERMKEPWMPNEIKKLIGVK